MNTALTLETPPRFTLARAFPRTTALARALWWMAMRSSKKESLQGESDLALMEQARLGGANGELAFEVLVERYQGWMLHLVMHLLGGQRAQAEDVVQDVFVRAFLALESFRGEGNVKGWLRVIATRTTFSHTRAQKVSRGYEERFSDEKKHISQGFNLGGEGGVVARESLELLLKKLPYPYREILILRYVEEMDIKEIAANLKIGESAAKMRLKRARDEFRVLAVRLESGES